MIDASSESTPCTVLPGNARAMAIEAQPTPQPTSSTPPVPARSRARTSGSASSQPASSWVYIGRLNSSMPWRISAPKPAYGTPAPVRYAAATSGTA